MGPTTTSGWGGLGRRLHNLLLGVPVFVKVLGIALGMAVMLGGGMVWQINRTWHGLLVRDLERRGQVFAEKVAEHCVGLVRAGRAAELGQELHHLLSETPDVLFVVLQERDGRMLAEARAPVGSSGGGGVHEFVKAIGDGPHELRVGLSLAGVEYEVKWLTRRLAGTTALIGLLGMAAAWWLTRLFAQPIEELVTLTRAIKAGRYEAKAPIRAQDEVGELAAAFNEMTEALSQKEAARQQLLRQVIRAGEEERKRVARELHDQTGQALTSLIAGLGALECDACPAAHSERIQELRRLAEQTLGGVHDISVALRPSVLDDVGLMAALERHCRTFGERFGVDVACAEAGLDGRRLPAEMELAIYRVAQEALSNAVRHGQAPRMRVLVKRTETGVLTMVQDNGCGFDSEHWRESCMHGNHLGLLGIEERVTLLGGSFCVESQPGQGTTVYADIPLQELA